MTCKYCRKENLRWNGEQEVERGRSEGNVQSVWTNRGLHGSEG